MSTDWKSATKALAKALAKSIASSLVRGVLLVGTSLVLNLAMAVVFFFLSGLTGGGHGSLILFPLALVPFVPFVAAAVFIAHKNAVLRIAGAALASQAPTLALVGSGYLGTYLAERRIDVRTTRLGAAFNRTWARYLRGRREAPWAVRMVMVAIARRVPLGETLDELAAAQTPPEQLPRIAIDRTIHMVADGQLEPGWTPVLVLFALNVVWLPLVTWAFNAWTSGA